MNGGQDNIFLFRIVRCLNFQSINRNMWQINVVFRKLIWCKRNTNLKTMGERRDHCMMREKR